MSNPQKEVHIEYTNWRNEWARRRILPLNLIYENNEWHPQTQWFVEAVDLDKSETRLFALASIHSWNPV